mgnify:CR=1 FL=1
MESEVIERFLRYAAIDTGSVEDAEGFPSTEKQKDLGRLLAKELSEMGAEDVFFDEENGYVYAHLSASEGVTGDGKTLAFLAHMDTSPEVSGKNVRPQLVRDYDGGDIVLDSENGVILSPLEFPELKNNSLIHDLVLYRVKTIQTLENVLSCIKEVDVKESQNGEMLTCSI